MDSFGRPKQGSGCTFPKLHSDPGFPVSRFPGFPVSRRFPQLYVRLYMTVDDELFSIIRDLRAWAAQKAFVRRLWVFGSRLRGMQRPDSDLDVALEIEAVGNDENALTSWLSVSASCKSEIQCLCPFSIDLQVFDSSAPHVVQYVHFCSMLVYERVT